MLFKLIYSIIRIFVLLLFLSKSEIALKLILVLKENEILKRRLKLQNKKPVCSPFDRFILALLVKLSTKVNEVLSLVKPKTVLGWYHDLIKKRWTFVSTPKKPGRPGILASTKLLILQLKNENIYMHSGKIRGELLKLGIDVSVSSIRRVLREFRKHGKFKSCITWKQYVNTNNHKSALSRLHPRNSLEYL